MLADKYFFPECIVPQIVWKEIKVFLRTVCTTVVLSKGMPLFTPFAALMPFMYSGIPQRSTA